MPASSVEIPYVKCEGSHGYSYRPYLPVTFSYGDQQLPIGRALVDTGSDLTILPLQVAHYLRIELDDVKKVTIDCAGGGRFIALPSQHQVGYMIDAPGYRPIRWKGIVYFAENEPVVLLGYHQCLEKFDLTFRGPERKLGIIPRFRLS
ncbi:MAG: hypothetical protein PHZ00_07580 [Candidatus Peribacteraceae bacterium]|nr:hypothetical protein [Candidatus Peribacteraceae bacterium]